MDKSYCNIQQGPLSFNEFIKNLSMNWMLKCGLCRLSALKKKMSSAYKMLPSKHVRAKNILHLLWFVIIARTMQLYDIDV